MHDVDRDCFPSYSMPAWLLTSPGANHAVLGVDKRKRRRIMRRALLGVLCLCAVMLIVLAGAPPAVAEDQPQYGGTLRVAIAGDPPSLDMHQEQTFMVTIPMSSVYNTLVTFDPHGFPNIIGDLAKSWERSE